MTRRIISALFALMLVLSCLPVHAEGTNGTLKVGMECGYAPFNWMQPNETEFTAPVQGGGYADGYDVQIARMIADALNMDLVIVKTEWDGLAMAVQSGAIDAIIAGMSPTAQRRMTLDFTDHYYQSELVVVVRKDGAYANATKLSDLSGANIVAQLNTFHDTVVDQIPGVKHAMPMESFPAMVVALQSGAVDGYVAERPGAVADVTANPDLTFIEFEEGQGFVASEDDTAIAIGLKIGSPLLSQINDVLATLDQAAREQLMLDATARQPLNN